MFAPGALAKEVGGTESKLPVDDELFGAWIRTRTPQKPAQAVHYQKTGLYNLVDETGIQEQGLWVTFVRGNLRWIRRCPLGGSVDVSPKDCKYFGRYQVQGDTSLDEDVCLSSWGEGLRSARDFEASAKLCKTPSRRIEAGADFDSLEAALETEIEELPEFVPEVSPELAKAAAEVDGEDQADSVLGTWVGAIGSGPEKVGLTFEAKKNGTFVYTLEAAGQKESSSGTWKAVGESLILSHPDGEIERIPFAVVEDAKGRTLNWEDEDLGTLALAQS